MLLFEALSYVWGDLELLLLSGYAINLRSHTESLPSVTPPSTERFAQAIMH